MVVSELAGKASVLAKAAELGLTVDDDLARAVVERVKELEHQGYYFEAADGSLELLIREMTGWSNPFFEIVSLKVESHRTSESEMVAIATVELLVEGESEVSMGEGVGLVHALDEALRGALLGRYPEIASLRLTDYRVRVLLETSGYEESWSTLGVHENVIEASWRALVDGIVIGLLRNI